MNIAFFLLPKEEIVYLMPDATMRQALERMEHHRYTAVPLVDSEGKYAGTLTEGDLLWKLKNTPGLSFETAHKVRLSEVPRRMNNKPIRIDAQIQDLVILASTQNFVPVVDDQGTFIGMIRRKEIIEYCHQVLTEQGRISNSIFTS